MESAFLIAMGILSLAYLSVAVVLAIGFWRRAGSPWGL